jgi:ABC-2 type transport system permease protein
MPESPDNSHINESQVIAPAVLSPARTMRWSIQRELWENRSIYLAPLAIATLFLLGFAISTFRLSGKLRSVSELDSTRLHDTIIQPYHWASLLIMGATFIVAFFYCLDALYGERRDRSILFWKSLPVSDLTTVLSKMAIPVIVLPLLTVAITIATHWLMLLCSSIVILASGMKLAVLWTHLPLFQMWTMLLFHLLVVHGLYYAPFYAWMLLVSGWARRAPFLWALLPPLAIGFVEKIAFNTTYFGKIIESHFVSSGDAGPFPAITWQCIL